MNKLLLGSTALLSAAIFSAPALSAERIQLQLRGYHIGGIAITDMDGSSTVFAAGGPPVTTPISEHNGINFGSDSEVHFRGSTTLDNGLEVSFVAQLELENDSDVDDNADQIDEVYIQFQGGFGRLQFGQNDGAVYQMHIAAPNTFMGHGVNQADTEMDPFAPFNSDLINTYADLSDDNIKLTYFTPSFNGLQFGASYTPNPCKNDTGYAGCVGDDWRRNFWEFGGSWQAQLDNMSLGLSAGYGVGEEGTSGPPGGGDPTEWSIGGEIAFGGLTFGGSYRDQDLGDLIELTSWDIGATYESGPWGLTAQYAEGDLAASTGGAPPNKADIDQEAWMVGATYMYGPGMQLGVGVMGTEANAFFDSAFGADVLTVFDGTAVFIENALTF